MIEEEVELEQKEEFDSSSQASVQNENTKVRAWVPIKFIQKRRLKANFEIYMKNESVILIYNIMNVLKFL